MSARPPAVSVVNENSHPRFPEAFDHEEAHAVLARLQNDFADESRISVSPSRGPALRAQGRPPAARRAADPILDPDHQTPARDGEDQPHLSVPRPPCSNALMQASTRATLSSADRRCVDREVLGELLRARTAASSMSSKRGMTIPFRARPGARRRRRREGGHRHPEQPPQGLELQQRRGREPQLRCGPLAGAASSGLSRIAQRTRRAGAASPAA
jgi:hypothetical protein